MARILLLGPNRERAAGVRSLLGQDGHEVIWTRSTETWRAWERKTLPELIVVAVGSTDRVLAAASETGHGFPPPLLFVQQEAELLREPHLQGRLIDRLASPFMGEEFL